MAHQHGYSEELVAAGQAILDSKTLSIGEKKDQFIDLLWEHNIPKKGPVHSSELLTHQKNRGGLMVNHNSAHRNGSFIRRVGANLAELHNAVSIEMSPDAKKRAEQVAANQAVITPSRGMLAPITGKERQLTLGTGHCAAFNNAANAGCRTPLTYLADKSGKIDLEFLKQQPTF